jgi:hypothetical protein
MIFNESVTTSHGRCHEVVTRTRALAGLEKGTVELRAEVLIHPGTHGLWKRRLGNGWDGSGS